MSEKFNQPNLKSLKLWFLFKENFLRCIIGTNLQAGDLIKLRAKCSKMLKKCKTEVLIFKLI